LGVSSLQKNPETLAPPSQTFFMHYATSVNFSEYLLKASAFQTRIVSTFAFFFFKNGDHVDKEQ